MPVAEAADIFLDAERDKAFKSRVKLLDEAKKRLREWFEANPAERVYDDRIAVKVTTFDRFSGTAARELLSEDQVDACMELTTRMELIPLET